MTEATPSTVDPTRFRSVMATFPAGVTIVTTVDPNGTVWGMTCSAVSSVSLDPPVLLVCLRDGSPTLAALLESSVFAVNLLHGEARTAADVFASPNSGRFEQVTWEWPDHGNGPHLVDDAHTIADCRVREVITVGDHTVVFGEVFDIERPMPERPAPLLYGLHDYWSLAHGRDGVVPVE